MGRTFSLAFFPEKTKISWSLLCSCYLRLHWSILNWAVLCARVSVGWSAMVGRSSWGAPALRRWEEGLNPTWCLLKENVLWKQIEKRNRKKKRESTECLHVIYCSNLYCCNKVEAKSFCLVCDVLVKFLELPMEMQLRLSSVFQHLLLMCWSCACVEGASLVGQAGLACTWR